jgi:hypothetical protein
MGTNDDQVDIMLLGIVSDDLVDRSFANRREVLEACGRDELCLLIEGILRLVEDSSPRLRTRAILQVHEQVGRDHWSVQEVELGGASLSHLDRVAQRVPSIVREIRGDEDLFDLHVESSVL